MLNQMRGDTWRDGRVTDHLCTTKEAIQLLSLVSQLSYHMTYQYMTHMLVSECLSLTASSLLHSSPLHSTVQLSPEGRGSSSTQLMLVNSECGSGASLNISYTCVSDCVVSKARDLLIVGEW